MTTTSPTRFDELNAAFPLRPIRSEKDHRRAIQIFASLASQRGVDARDYKSVLVKLIADFESGAGQRIDTSKVSASDIVRHLLDERKLSVNAFANKLGMSQGTLNEMLRGRRGWSKSAIEKISDYFNLSTDLFFNKKRIVPSI